MTLREGLYVRNVAADDLAFVYENTLITPETRKAFGTHSTPYSAADYVIRSLHLPDGNAACRLRVYEPFAGACVFLTAALAPVYGRHKQDQALERDSSSQTDHSGSIKAGWRPSIVARTTSEIRREELLCDNHAHGRIPGARY